MKPILYTATKTLIIDYVLNVFLNKVLCNFSKVSIIGNPDDPFNGKRYFKTFVYQGSNGGILWIGHNVTIERFWIFHHDPLIYRITLQSEDGGFTNHRGQIIYIQEDIIVVEKYSV